MNHDDGVTLRPPTIADVPRLGEVHAAAWRWCYRGVLADAFVDSLAAETFEGYHRPRFDAATGLPKDAGQPFFVACDPAIEGPGGPGGGGVIGFIRGGPTRDAAPTGEKLALDPTREYVAELYAIYVVQEWLGRNAGRTMLSAVLDAIIEQHKRSLCVWVLSANSLGRRFYERWGAELIRRSESPLTLGGVTYPQVAYGWKDAKALRRRLTID